MVVGKIPVSSGRAIRIPVSSGREIKIRISVPIREAIIPTNGNAAGNQSPRFKAGGILLGQSCFKPGSHGGFLCFPSQPCLSLNFHLLQHHFLFLSILFQCYSLSSQLCFLPTYPCLNSLWAKRWLWSSSLGFDWSWSLCEFVPAPPIAQNRMD